MSIEWIVFIIFIVLFIFMGVFYKKAILSKLRLLENEEIIFEDNVKKISQYGAPSVSVFYKCLIRITNKRIIIGQKTLFGNEYILRFILILDESYEDFNLKETLKKGFITGKINKEMISFKQEKDKNIVRIDIPNSTITTGRYIKFSTDNLEQYKSLFSS